MSFKQFNLHTQIETGIEALGYTAPTPIQLKAMPAVLAGKDVMGMAQTGTGKTAAFALPILQRLMNGPRRSLRAMIVAPTRELAEQIHEAIGGLGRATKLKSVTIYGGVNKNPQIRSLRQGVDIVVACPGRLLDLADQGEIDFSRIEVLVLDEADRMFDMGFLPDIRKIIKRLPTKRQTLLFSATMPEDIRKLAGEVLHDPVTIKVGTGAPVSTVSHAVYPVAPHLKTALLMKLLERTNTESVLVFTRTKHRTAQRLSRRYVSDPDRHRHRRPGNRRLRDIPCDQLRHAGHRRRLYAPDRPYGACRKDGGRLHLRDAGRQGLRGGHRACPWGENRKAHAGGLRLQCAGAGRRRIRPGQTLFRATGKIGARFALCPGEKRRRIPDGCSATFGTPERRKIAGRILSVSECFQSEIKRLC
jgi:hypothetical protein